MTEQWRISLLGGLRAELGGRTITRFKSQRIASLLAYLAYHLRQTHSRDFLIELIWPESGSLEAGRNSLSVALSSLRNQFEPPGTPSNSVIRADRYSVSLNPAAVIADVAEFEGQVRASLTQDFTYDRLIAILDLYHGRLLPTLYDEWIAAEQQRLSGLFADAATRLVDRFEQSGDLSSALAFARRAVAADEYIEDLHARVIRLLFETGQPAAALQHYKEWTRLAKDEMGQEPSQHLVALVCQIEQQSPTTALQSSPAAVRSEPTPYRTDSGGHHPATSTTDTLTVLFTDIEGSTKAWESTGEPYTAALRVHHSLLRQAFMKHGGRELKEAGDSFLVAFTGAAQALRSATEAQRTLAAYEGWPAETGPPAVRMALHTGDVDTIEGEYRGLTLHRASRILAAAHGGQVLASEATAAIVRRDLPEGVRLVDLGVYRLRDIAASERLFQVEFPGMPQTQFAPPNAETGHSSNLPLRFTRFFGRDEEITRLKAMLQPDSSVRLVTLTGPGGTGKTRLAVEVAERLGGDFGGAVWFVPLADLSNPSLLPDTTLAALKVPASPAREPMDQIADSLSRQHSLLVLDNVEHLVDGCAALVRILLDRVPSLKVLVTSRQTMGITGEHEFSLTPLPTPGSPDTPERLSLFESVQLFVDRAQAVMADFQVNNNNAPAVAELVARLEGIPLAIELAAARAQVLSPAQMLASLGQQGRFDLLVSRKRDVSERQRTLRGAVEWSYRLLAPELQRFFCRLSVFRGGWTTQAAEAVTEEPLALDYLAQLRECSLVLSRNDEESAGDIRFGLLETLREFGESHISAEERVLLRARHLHYFEAFAEEMRPQLSGTDQARCFNILDTEHDNLRHALDFSAQHHEHGPAGLRLAGALSIFWETHGHLREGRDRLSMLLDLPPTQERNRERAFALNGAGNLAFRQGDFRAARLHYEESLSIRREIGDMAGVAGSFGNLGSLAIIRGDYVAARALYEESVAIFRQIGLTANMANPLSNLGNVLYELGELAEARAVYEEALKIETEEGNHGGRAMILSNLGVVAYEEGDFATARSYQQESLPIWQDLRSDRGIAMTLNCLGDIALEEGDLAASRAAHREALLLRRDLEDLSGIAYSLEALAALDAREGKMERALRSWGAAERLREEIECPLRPGERRVYDREVAAARELVEEEAFSKGWAEGRAVTAAQAVEQLLGA